MEDLLKEATKTIEEVQEAAPIIAPEPENNNLRDAGIVIGVIVVAAICAKLYKCTAKKK